MKSKTGQAAKMHYEYGRKAVAAHTHTHAERGRESRLTHSERRLTHRKSGWEGGTHAESAGQHTYRDREADGEAHTQRAGRHTHAESKHTHTHTERAVSQTHTSPLSHCTALIALSAERARIAAERRPIERLNEWLTDRATVRQRQNEWTNERTRDRLTEQRATVRITCNYAADACPSKIHHANTHKCRRRQQHQLNSLNAHMALLLLQQAQHIHIPLIHSLTCCDVS